MQLMRKLKSFSLSAPADEKHEGSAQTIPVESPTAKLSTTKFAFTAKPQGSPAPTALNSSGSTVQQQMS
jgi:hypothetical protein